MSTAVAHLSNVRSPISDTAVLPALVAAAGDHASTRFTEFFAANIRNPHTRRAYMRAVADFMAWCKDAGAHSIGQVQRLHVAAWVELQTRQLAAPTTKLRLTAVRHLFDWLVIGQILPVNPAASVCGPRHIVKSGKTPELKPADARALLDSIDVTSAVGLRDRALIALTFYSLARIDTALEMKVEDVFTRKHRLWVRLHEKGGHQDEMPCHRNLAACLIAYIDGAHLADYLKGPLFRTIGRGTGRLTQTKLPKANAYAMIERRAASIGITMTMETMAFGATGIMYPHRPTV
jgi:site-specific recombinase XerC